MTTKKTTKIPFPIHSAPGWWQDDNLLLAPRNTSLLESKRRTHNMALFTARLGRGAFSTRCNRMWLGKDLKYYKHFAQHLQLEQDGDSGWRVSWKKKFPTTLAPLEPIMQSLTGKLLILTTGFSAKKENYEICNLSENNPLPRDILPYRTLKDSLTK